VAAYRAAGQLVIPASARTGAGLDEVRGALLGKTTALAGLSGVGKSSLLNGIGLGLNLRIGEVSECYHAGRHTTTQVSLHPLSVSGFVVDTPGIREFGLVGLSRSQLARFYPEFAACGPCAYADCSHTREPGCTVKAAVRSGRMSAMRLDSYRKIWHDLAP
jgi:ribosome biogenesis GTPase